MNLQIDRPFVIFDLETTGLRKPIRAVQVAAIRYEPDGSVREFCERVAPGQLIEPGALRVHGISDAVAAMAASFVEQIEEMTALFSGADWCGFNIIKYDTPILMGEFERAGVTLDRSGARTVDVMRLFHHFSAGRLGDAHQQYCGGCIENAHDALADARATARILFEMVERHQLPRDVEGLSHFLERAAAAKAARTVDRRFQNRAGELIVLFGKHRGRSLNELARTNRDYLEWMLRSNFPDDVKLQIRRVFNGGSW